MQPRRRRRRKLERRPGETNKDCDEQRGVNELGERGLPVLYWPSSNENLKNSRRKTTKKYRKGNWMNGY